MNNTIIPHHFDGKTANQLLQDTVVDGVLVPVGFCNLTEMAKGGNRTNYQLDHYFCQGDIVDPLKIFPSFLKDQPVAFDLPSGIFAHPVLGIHLACLMSEDFRLCVASIAMNILGIPESKGELFIARLSNTGFLVSVYELIVCILDNEFAGIGEEGSWLRCIWKTKLGCVVRGESNTFLKAVNHGFISELSRPATKITRICQVYFVLNPLSNLIKIGVSSNVVARIRQIEAACGTDLVLLGVIDGGLDKEKELHVKFDSFRQKGEWFENSEVIHDWIKAFRLN